MPSTIDPIIQKAEDAFSANAKAVMRVRVVTPADLARASEASGGPSKKTIYNILNKAHPPNLENWGYVAKLLDVPLWALLIPDLDQHEELLDRPGMKRLVALMEHYLASTDAKRADIEAVAKAGAITSDLTTARS